jgi:ribosome-binding factor A
VSDALRDILANIFISQVQINYSGLLTISNVTVTYDLKIAKVYISFLDNEKPIEELMSAIISKRNVIKSLVSKELTLKYIPELRFFHDNTMEQTDKINQLMNSIKYND